MSTRVPRAVWLAVAAGLAARLVFALGYWTDKPLTQDEQEYLALAAGIASGRGFVAELPGLPDGPPAERFSRAPLYPAFLAAVHLAARLPIDRLPTSVPRAVQVAQACVSVLAIWLIAGLASRAGGPRAGSIAAWMAALHPVMIWLPAYALTECVYSTAVLAAVWWLGVRTDRPEPEPAAPGWAAALAGALSGAAVLIRSATLVFAALAVAWLLKRRQARDAIAFAVCAAAVVAPWTARNVVTHARPMLVAADGGVNFWIGNHPDAIGEGDLAANPRLKDAHVAFRSGLSGLTPEQREPFYYRAALRFIADHPGRWLRLEARKAFYMAVPIGPSYRLHSTRYFLGTVIPYGLLLPLALVGFWRMRQAGRMPVSLCLLPLSYVVICLVFFPQERFRVPAVDPALIVGASALLAGLAQHRSRET